MKKKKYLKKFFSNKYNFYKENFKSNKNILLVDRQRFDNATLNSILALAVNKKYKMNVIVLSDLKSDNFLIKFYKHLGFKKYLLGVGRFQYIKYFHLFFLSIIISTIAIFNILNKNFLWFIDNFKIKNIPFGDLIYDTNIRYYHRYRNPKIDFYFIKILISSTFRILLLFKYFDDYKINRVVAGTENYSYNSGIAIRISLFKKINNYYSGRFNNGEFEVGGLTKQGLFLGYDNLKNKEIQSRFKNFNPKKKEINKFYHMRKKSSNKSYSWTMSTYNEANKKSKIGLNFLNKISKVKNNKILYASHAFSDAPHAKGLNYSFEDFYSQLKETLSFIKKNDKNNVWIFRSHPSSKLFNEYYYFKELINDNNMKNIYLCPLNVPIKKLYKVCDTVVTGSGTVGLEFLCEGKQSILAGSAAYSIKELTPYFAHNKEEYFYYLKNINRLAKPKIRDKELAKKVLYFFESGTYLSRKISSKDAFQDKICKEFFSKNFGYGLNLNDYLNISYNLLKKDIYKSKIFNKISKLS